MSQTECEVMLKGPNKLDGQTADQLPKSAVETQYKTREGHLSPQVETTQSTWSLPSGERLSRQTDTGSAAVSVHKTGLEQTDANLGNSWSEFEQIFAHGEQ